MPQLNYKISALEQVLETAPLKQTNDAFHGKNRDICFDHITFGYEKTQPGPEGKPMVTMDEVITDVSSTVKAGQKTALVGESGSGKSTLAKLLIHYYDPQQGSISIGGQKITEMSLEALNNQISYVAQDQYLFNTSLLENIRMGRPDATDEEVLEAAKKAQCLEFLEKLPQGIRSMAGDAGMMLSGGQRQRISLARAILKNAPIIVLDDDGFSGVNFERPVFKRMLEDVGNGKIKTVITKDLSRFGRNHLYVGLYKEKYFPKNNVQYIAINDNVDAANSSGMDMAMFFNIFNEFHVRDTSKKIKASCVIKSERGQRVASRPPYGYMKSQEDHNKILPNPETSPVVKHIFQLCAGGLGTSQIANRLEEEQIYTSAMYEYSKSGNVIANFDISYPYRWNSNAISNILEDVSYIGHTCNFRFGRHSYKDRRKIKLPESEHRLIENTHEPLIDVNTWEIVQRLRKSKCRKTSLGNKSIFAGITFCADCKHKLYFHRHASEKPENWKFICSLYRKNRREQCTIHGIKESHLKEIVLSEIRNVTEFARERADEFAEFISQKSNSSVKKELAEVGIIFRKLYEDHVLGTIDDEQFRMLSQGYTEEQNKLKADISELNNSISELQSQTANTSKFISLARKYTDITELTQEILHTFVSRIEVHEKQKDGNGNVSQEVDIYFTHIGTVK